MKRPDTATMAAAAVDARKEMERLGAEVRDLVLAQPPIKLLSYVMSHFHVALMYARDDDDSGANKEVIKTFQRALEYLHAVWSSHSPLANEATPLDEAEAGRLLAVFDALDQATFFYCLASSTANLGDDRNPSIADLEIHAKTAWALVRGNRYQVLEEEFFRFVLAPHDAALREAYGVGSSAIAAGIQAIADTMRTGVSSAAEEIGGYMDRVNALAVDAEGGLEAAMRQLDAEDPQFRTRAADLFTDMLFAGICNLSRHSSLPPALLEDLSYVPGENTEFFAPGDYAGTPMRTLPARVKPGIKLGDDYYTTDGQFVRDSAYRAIQRGLAKRLPYRDTWLKRQGELIEDAFSAVFSTQLAGAETIRSVYYRDPATGNWAETDRIIILDDVLFVIEAKAGNLPMHSPSTNFASHERVIQALLVKAFQQCQRFINYLASESEVPLFTLDDGKYVEIRRARMCDFSEILPIGLTVEAFTPFSAMAKEMPGIVPIAGRFPFVAMSVDDLFLLSRLLPTTGALLHYLRTRQFVAGITNAMLFDETDHLGAYISDNRFDLAIREQLREATAVTWDSFSDIIDRYFEGADWETRPVPSQDLPPKLAEILAVLDQQRPALWLRVDRHLRDYGGAGRADVVTYIETLELSLRDHPRRRFDLAGDDLFQTWLCRAGEEPPAEELRRYGQASCIALGKPTVLVLVLSYRKPCEIAYARCATFGAPTILQNDYTAVQALATAQRSRVREIPDAKPNAKKGRKRRR